MTSKISHIQMVIVRSTDVGEIWSATVVRYEATTGVRIQSLVGPKSVDEILIDFKDKENIFAGRRHDGSRVDKFRSLVRKSLGPIEMWGKVITNATKNIFPASEAIFAAVQYLISTAKAVSADFDRLEEFFEELSSYLTRLKVWESEIPQITELEEVMTEVFTSVLVLCGICTKYVRMRRLDSKLQSEVELICSLTRQLVEQIHPISEEVKTYRDRWIEKRSYPTQEERVSLIEEVASHFTRTYIFVDALDECPEQNRNEFLHMLQMLEPSVHLFITSRPNLELHSTFPHLSHIEIVASHSDIQVYLESEISTNNRMSRLIARDTTLKAEIIDIIIKKAEGMFLVAHFQVAYICQMASPKKVRQCLNTLSTKIYDFYEKALTRIEDYFEEDRQLVKKALAYIFCAQRPLTLEKLRHALGIETEDTELDESALPEMEILLSISVGLIHLPLELPG
ncbi:Goodbye multi-domain protein [Pyrenophora tritici-repentis]|nr:Goodbye multi-domain protein [Pyrenophora tritici-repentis]